MYTVNCFWNNWTKDFFKVILNKIKYFGVIIVIIFICQN